VVAGNSENINAQLLKLGLTVWDTYFILRAEPPAPVCDPDADIEQTLDQLEARFNAEHTGFSLIDDEFDRKSARVSLVKQQIVCQKKHQDAAIYAREYSFGVALYSVLEDSFAQISLSSINHQKTILILLLMLCA